MQFSGTYSAFLYSGGTAGTLYNINTQFVSGTDRSRFGDQRQRADVSLLGRGPKDCLLLHRRDGRHGNGIDNSRAVQQVTMCRAFHRRRRRRGGFR